MGLSKEISLTERQSGRILGIDTLRFICATSVVFSHLRPPAIFDFIGPPYGDAIRGCFALAFPGAPAVIVFFVISGLCIHLAGVQGRSFNAISFYCHRFTRLLIPLLVTVAVLPLIGMRFAHLNNTILWSLYCELIYYIAYPFIRRYLNQQGGSRKSKILVMISISLAISSIIVIWNFEILNFHELGVLWTAILALPSWLFGLLLAEQLPLRNEVTVWEIWSFRVTALLLAAIATYMRFHLSIGFPCTLTLYGLFTYFWLKREIAWCAMRRVSKTLEQLGKISYSLYLFHIPGAAATSLLYTFVSGSRSHNIELLGAFILSLVFYFVIEKPSHRVAVRIKKLVDGTNPRTKLAS